MLVKTAAKMIDLALHYREVLHKHQGEEEEMP